jgi:hypothetical protein
MTFMVCSNKTLIGKFARRQWREWMQRAGAVLACRGHLLTENRNGLIVATLTTRAYGSAERHAALLMAEGLPRL